MELELKRIDKQTVLIINDVVIPISNYLIKSSAEGTTELTVTICGISSIFELSTNLEE